jgi:hypothetical protein
MIDKDLHGQLLLVFYGLGSPFFSFVFKTFRLDLKGMNFFVITRTTHKLNFAGQA